MFRFGKRLESSFAIIIRNRQAKTARPTLHSIAERAEQQQVTFALRLHSSELAAEGSTRTERSVWLMVSEAGA
jgi:hypothetical protein